jgi:hypothetical protein
MKKRKRSSLRQAKPFRIPVPAPEIDGLMLKLIEERMDTQGPIDKNALIQGFLDRHPFPEEGDNVDLYLGCAWQYLGSRAQRVIRGLKVVPGGKVPGWKHLQKRYAFKRGGRSAFYRLEELTDEELLAKAEHYEALARGDREHADEIRRFVEERRNARDAAE